MKKRSDPISVPVTNNVTPEHVHSAPKTPVLPEKIDDFAGWAIVNTASGAFIGRVDRDSCDVGEIALCPAYQYLTQSQVGPNGIQNSRMIIPIEMSAKLDRVVVRWSSVIYIEGFHESERRDFLSQIQNAEKIRAEVRARHSGIVLGGNGALAAQVGPRVVR